MVKPLPLLRWALIRRSAPELFEGSNSSPEYEFH